MSRYDSDRDEDFYRRRDVGDERRPRGGREYYADDRPASPPPYRDDEHSRGYGREEMRRDYDGERASARGGRADYYRDDYDAPPRPRREDDGGGNEREEGGRSTIERAGEYVRETFGGRRHRGIGRGASRSHVRCRDIMTRDVTVAMRDTTLEEVARMMRDEDTGVIPVVEPGENAPDSVEEVERRPARTAAKGKLVGLITDRDIVIRAIADGMDPRTLRAEEVMTIDLHSVRPNDRVIEAIRKMGDRQVRRLPVVDREGALRGIISMADIALETEADRELGEALEEISSGSSFWNRIFS